MANRRITYVDGPTGKASTRQYPDTPKGRQSFADDWSTITHSRYTLCAAQFDKQGRCFGSYASRAFLAYVEVQSLGV